MTPELAGRAPVAGPILSSAGECSLAGEVVSNWYWDVEACGPQRQWPKGTSESAIVPPGEDTSQEALSRWVDGKPQTKAMVPR
jgi:hypothetical protein